MQIHFLPAEQFSGLSWDGLYLVAPEMGAGIAIRDDLEKEWRDWILAHELGHHFSHLNGTLFSPFAAHRVDAESRARWNKGKLLHPDEVRANAWAANALIHPQAWIDAESSDPFSLLKIVQKLGLPIPAAISWERLHRATINGAKTATVRVKAEDLEIITKAVEGTGGHQSLFRRLQANVRDRRIQLTYRDFSLARERVVTVQGGWLARYQALIRSVTPHVESAGGVRPFFKLQDVDFGLGHR